MPQWLQRLSKNRSSTEVPAASIAGSSSTLPRKIFPSGIKLLHNPENGVVEYVGSLITWYNCRVLAPASKPCSGLRDLVTASTYSAHILCSVIASFLFMDSLEIARGHGERKMPLLRGLSPCFHRESTTLAFSHSDTMHMYPTGEAWCRIIGLEIIR